MGLLRRGEFDRFGYFDHWWPETIADVWPAQGFPKGANPEILFDTDIMNCGGDFDSTAYPGKKDIVQETDEWYMAKDGRLATLKFWKKKSGTPEHISFEVTTPEKWKSYRERLLGTEPSRIDFERARTGLALARQRGKMGLFFNQFVVELLRATLGDEAFLSSLLEEPEWIKDFCQVYLDFYRRHYELLFKEVGLPDGMFIYEDMAYKNGLFCSPGALRELILPYHKALLDFFKSYKLPVVLHSCGDIRRAMPVILDAGWDCLQPMEAKAGVNVVELAKEYGKKITFMGNIDVTVLHTNDQAKIKEEIEIKIKGLKELKAAYFFHSDHSIPPNVTYDTYRFTLETFRKASKI
jgi:uroporphyrinogen decarboxylase